MGTDLLAISAGAAIAAAVATCFIAVFTYRAALSTHKAVQAQLMSSLLGEYQRAEMLDAITSMDNWVKSNEKSRRGQVSLIKEQRRLFSHYFQKVHALHGADLLDMKVVEAVVTRGQAELYLAIEPLEAMINPNYDPLSFRFFAQRYRLPRTNA